MNSLRLDRSIVLGERGASTLARMVIILELVLLAAFAWWASTATIEETAVCPGEMLPISTVNRVQSETGGTIKAILVRPGDKVEEGDVILEFESGQAGATLRSSKARLSSLRSQRALLEEELSIVGRLVGEGVESKLNQLGLKRQLLAIEGQIAEEAALNERLTLAVETATLLAPASGYVHNLRFRASGEVVQPGALVLEIVPSDDRLVAEVRVSPKDIGFVKVGASVLVKVSAYDFGRFGGIRGTLEELSPTRLTDEQGSPYYRGVVILDSDALEYRGESYPLLPGMGIAADVRAGSKTVMEYLLKPLAVSAREAFRER
jgi:adhesin transport system membrane fusion protein